MVMCKFVSANANLAIKQLYDDHGESLEESLSFEAEF